MKLLEILSDRRSHLLVDLLTVMQIKKASFSHDVAQLRRLGFNVVRLGSSKNGYAYVLRDGDRPSSAPNGTRSKLWQLLSNGQWYTKRELCNTLQCSHSSVNSAVKMLRQSGARIAMKRFSDMSAAFRLEPEPRVVANVASVHEKEDEHLRVLAEALGTTIEALHRLAAREDTQRLARLVEQREAQKQKVEVESLISTVERIGEIKPRHNYRESLRQILSDGNSRTIRDMASELGFDNGPTAIAVQNLIHDGEVVRVGSLSGQGRGPERGVYSLVHLQKDKVA